MREFSCQFFYEIMLTIFFLFLDFEKTPCFITSPTVYGCLILLSSELKTPGSGSFSSKYRKQIPEQILEASQAFPFSNLF